MTKKILVVLALCAAAVAFAAAEGSFNTFSEFKPSLFIKGLYVGPNVGTNKVQASTLNKVTAIRGAFGVYNFPALGGLATNTPACNDDFTLTMTGALPGDVCQVASNFGVDGGSRINVDAWLTASVTAADTARVKVCTAIMDGGQVDLADAGYTVVCTSLRAQ